MAVWSTFLFTSVASCQNSFEISGEVSDTDNKFIPVGDVLLFDQKEDSLVTYAVVLDGKFSLSAVPEGTYRLQISCLGFEPQERFLRVDRHRSLQITMEEDATALDEVEVIAAKPIVTNKNGNLRFDIQNPVFSSIPDPVEVLAKLPGIRLSLDKESLTIMGKGPPLIYIGNRRIGWEEFGSLPVDAIDSIEIIKNPSAKYGAEGRSVLLVTLKINADEGVKLNFSETVSLKQNFHNYNALNGSLKRKKVTVRANVALNALQTWESHRFAFDIPAEDITSNYAVLIGRNDRFQINTGGGIFYQINAHDHFSVNTNFRLQNDRFPIDTRTFLRQEKREDHIVTKTGNDNQKNFGSTSLNYNKRIGSTANLFTGLQYSSFVQKLNTVISNDYNDTGFVNSQDRRQRYRINVFAYRLDVEKSFGNGFKMEIGNNISTAKANALTDIRFSGANRMPPIDFDYTETNFAGYSQLSGNWNKSVDFNIGLRMEHNTVRSGAQADELPVVNRKNTNLFPSMLLTIEIDSTKNLSFNYKKSITRPDYSRASSISSFINPFLEGSGNVNLRPTMTQEFTVNFQKKNTSISINYLRKINPMYFTIGYEEGAENAILSLRNLEKETGLDLGLDLPMTKGIWTSTNSAMISTRWTKDGKAETTPSKPYVYVYTDQQFKIAKDTTIAIGGWGFTKRSEGIFNRNALFSLNASLAKTFFEKLHCALRWNDITRAMNFEEAYSINGVDAKGVYFGDGREIAFSLKYAFGSTKDPKYQNQDIDGNLDRIK